MAGNGKDSKHKDLRKDLSAGQGETGMTSINTATLRTLSDTTIERMKDSVIENLGAFQFLLDREEVLKGYHKLMRELLADCKTIATAHGHEALAAKIDKTLQETKP